MLASFIALRDTCELLGAARRDGLRVSPAGGRVDEAPLLRVVRPHFLDSRRIVELMNYCFWYAF